jgi:hypothetical protein
LALVLGTSLSGLNADQAATKTASRSLQSGNKRLKGRTTVKSHGNYGAIGMAMINLQQTAHDGKACLRIFGTSDDVFAALLSKVNIPTPTMEPQVFDQSTRRFFGAVR